MPLPNVVNSTALRCRAKCKATGMRCLNPAAFGMPVCRCHGARRPETIKRGKSHPNYIHGDQTLVSKAERSATLVTLRELEALSFEMGLAKGYRWRGRKPRVS
jgi:hypothetical protein